MEIRFAAIKKVRRFLVKYVHLGFEVPVPVGFDLGVHHTPSR